MPIDMNLRNNVNVSVASSKIKMSALKKRTLVPAWVGSESITMIRELKNAKNSPLEVARVMETGLVPSMNVS